MIDVWWPYEFCNVSWTQTCSVSKKTKATILFLNLFPNLVLEMYSFSKYIFHYVLHFSILTLKVYQFVQWPNFENVIWISLGHGLMERHPSMSTRTRKSLFLTALGHVCKMAIKRVSCSLPKLRSFTFRDLEATTTNAFFDRLTSCQSQLHGIYSESKSLPASSMFEKIQHCTKVEAQMGAASEILQSLG